MAKLDPKCFPIRIFTLDKKGTFESQEWIEGDLDDLREAIKVLKQEKGLQLFYWSEGYCEVISEEEIFEE